MDRPPTPRPAAPPDQRTGAQCGARQRVEPGRRRTRRSRRGPAEEWPTWRTVRRSRPERTARRCRQRRRPRCRGPSRRPRSSRSPDPAETSWVAASYSGSMHPQSGGGKFGSGEMDAASRARIVDADGAWRTRAPALRRTAPAAARLRWDRRHTSPVVARIAAAGERPDAGLAAARSGALLGARLDRAARGAVRVRPAAGHGTRPAAGRS
jgi:hypothetical protein